MGWSVFLRFPASHALVLYPNDQCLASELGAKVLCVTLDQGSVLPPSPPDLASHHGDLGGCARQSSCVKPASTCLWEQPVFTDLIQFCISKWSNAFSKTYSETPDIFSCTGVGEQNAIFLKYQSSEDTSVRGERFLMRKAGRPESLFCYRTEREENRKTLFLIPQEMCLSFTWNLTNFV